MSHPTPLTLCPECGKPAYRCGCERSSAQSEATPTACAHCGFAIPAGNTTYCPECRKYTPGARAHLRRIAHNGTMRDTLARGAESARALQDAVDHGNLRAMASPTAEELSATFDRVDASIAKLQEAIADRDASEVVQSFQRRYLSEEWARSAEDCHRSCTETRSSPCALCGRPGEHKIEQATSPASPYAKRHWAIAIVCCACFARLFGERERSTAGCPPAPEDHGHRCDLCPAKATTRFEDGVAEKCYYRCAVHAPALSAIFKHKNIMHNLNVELTARARVNAAAERQRAWEAEAARHTCHHCGATGASVVVKDRSDASFERRLCRACAEQAC